MDKSKLEIVKESIRNNFDAIIYINRSSDGKRQIHMQNEFGNMGIPLHRIDAITPENSDFSDRLRENNNHYKDVPYRIKDYTPQTLKEMSCASSHALALNAVMTLGYGKALILEDDVKLTDFEITNIPKEWDFLWLNYLTFTYNAGDFLTESGYYIDLFKRNEDWFQARKGLFSTSAYAVNFKKIGMQRLNQIIYGLTEGVIADFYMSEVVQPEFNCFAQFNRTLVPTGFKSTIGDNYKGIEDAYKNIGLDDYIIGHCDMDKIELTKYIDKSNHTEGSKFITLIVNDVFEDYLIYEDDNDINLDLSRVLDLGASTISENITVKDVYDIKIFETIYPPKSNKGKRKILFHNKPQSEMVKYENITVKKAIEAELFKND